MYLFDNNTIVSVVSLSQFIILLFVLGKGILSQLKTAELFLTKASDKRVITTYDLETLYLTIRPKERLEANPNTERSRNDASFSKQLFPNTLPSTSRH